MSEAQRSREREYERVTGRPHRIITISDPTGIRALAHKARQQVIEVLYGAEHPYTSTELSALTGLSPSAMSYHLRALEKWGVVERVSGAGDARNRPWRAAGAGIRISSEGPAGQAAADLWTEQAIDRWRDRVAHQRTLPKERREQFVGLAQDQLWLTDEQIERYKDLVESFHYDLVAEGWTNEPGEGRTRIGTLWSLLPEPD